MRFKKNILLRNFTTFKIGGPAKYFFIARTKEDLISAIKLAKKIKLPFFILAGGSNLLISDKGYKGLVIKTQNSKLKTLNSKIITETGAKLSELVKLSLRKSLTGLEWAVGIPGAVGGAIYGNTGAFRKSMKDIIREVKVFDTKEQKIKIFKNKDCKFTYRDSIFKKNKNLIIFSCQLQLRKSNKKAIQKKIKEYLNYKKTTQPLNYPSPGSIFKNPRRSLSYGGQARKFSAAELIEKSNLKGKKIGKAKISEKHANFIINLGGAKAEDVKKLINLIKKQVKNKFGIKLEEEIEKIPKKF